MKHFTTLSVEKTYDNSWHSQQDQSRQECQVFRVFQGHPVREQNQAKKLEQATYM